MTFAWPLPLKGIKIYYWAGRAWCSSLQPVHPPKATSQAPCHARHAPASSGEDVPAWPRGHSRNRKQNLHSLCLGSQPSSSFPQPASLSFLTPGLHPPGLPQCPWHRGPGRASTQPRAVPLPAQPHEQPLRSGKQGRGLASSPAPLAVQPLPRAKGDPPVSLALTCCPKRVPWQGWGELCSACPGWKSPRPGAGWDSLARRRFSRTPDGKEIQPRSPPLPFRKQL